MTAKPETDKGRQGFASMDQDRRRAIAAKGGKAAHQKGTAYEWTSEEAQAARRKGGLVSSARKRALLRVEAWRNSL